MARRGDITPRVAEMLRLRDRGLTFREIGDRLGVAPQSVQRACTLRRPLKMRPIPPFDRYATSSRREAR